MSLPGPHGGADVVADRPVDSVQAEAAQQQQPLEGRQVLLVLQGESGLLRALQVVPLRGSHHQRIRPSEVSEN